MNNKIRVNGKTIDEDTFQGFKNSLKNQIFKLLPMREKNEEWEKHLETLMLEMYGADLAFATINFYRVISKLAILPFLEYKYFRKTVFECLSLIDVLGQEDGGV